MPTRVHVSWGEPPAGSPRRTTLMLIGRAERLRGPTAHRLTTLDPAEHDALVDSVRAGDAGGAAHTWLQGQKIVLGVLPEPCSRHNSPSRAWAVPGLAARADHGDTLVVLLVDEAEHAFAQALGVARAFPLFDATTGEEKQRSVWIIAESPSGWVADSRINLALDAVRFAGRLVDTPTSTLHTSAFVEEALAVAQRTGAEVEVLSGEALRDGGFGGLWGVGKAAVHPPALVALRWRPEGAVRHSGWVGKGIVYDTGGLSIKGKDNMPGMKGDMAGAAAVLAAFEAAVTLGCRDALTAVLCLAENSVGPESTRPDDILTMRSGKTVEVNNTDAEGRLVLADGLAWLCEGDRPDELIDLATLTGAALVATGKVHAALYCSDEALEQQVLEVGRQVGEPCHPLPYAPELFRKEFRSPVADMKNSVKDRANAQSSCAGQFIANHLPDGAPPWCHIDIAGPAESADGRGTGFGVGLLLGLLSARAAIG